MDWEGTSDTQVRTILNEVNPEKISPAFPSVYRELNRSSELRKFVFLEGSYLLWLMSSVDRKQTVPKQELLWVYREARTQKGSP